jgi:cytochrome P450/NADPH-cytochrome P450 reductase
MSCPVSNASGPAPHPLSSQTKAGTSFEGEEAVIPQPPVHLFGLLGNLPDLEPSFPAQAFWHLQELYGPIVKLQLQNTNLIILSSQEFINEASDQDRFEKNIGGVLQEVRGFLKDGLFTAYPDEENWSIAHRTLMPVFGPIGVRKMFPEMLDIASQLILKWDRFGKNHAIDCADDFTRLGTDATLAKNRNQD